MARGIFLGVVALAAAYFVWRIVAAYRAATGTVWERALATAKGSATILWQYVVGAAGVAMTYAAQVADFFNMPEVRDFITKQLTPTQVGIALVAIAAITVWARMRNLAA